MISNVMLLVLVNKWGDNVQMDTYLLKRPRIVMVNCTCYLEKKQLIISAQKYSKTKAKKIILKSTLKNSVQ